MVILIVILSSLSYRNEDANGNRVGMGLQCLQASAPKRKAEELAEEALWVGGVEVGTATAAAADCCCPQECTEGSINGINVISVTRHVFLCSKP